MKKQKLEKTELEKRLEAEMNSEAAAVAEDAEVPDAALVDEGRPEGLEDKAKAAELDALKDQLLRARAEFDNYRKRVARDAERTRKLATESLMRDLLPVLDHLELALQHADESATGIVEGVDMVLKQFREALSRHGLVPIPAVGETFDPHVHEAVAHLDSVDFEADKVITEMQRGYWLGDQVLRHSRVAVSRGIPEEPLNEGEADSADASECE